MMNYIFAGIIIISLICAFITGKTQALSEAVVNGASESVKLLMTMAGMLTLWSGIMEVADRGGLTKLLCRILSPVLNLLFKNIDKKSRALKYISMNVSANLLGIGNAATPFGIQAVKELKKLNGESAAASDDMVVFVVMNTASIQLIPTMVAALRQSYGSSRPFSILPCVWISSACALAVGLFIAKIFKSRNKNDL